MQGSLLAGSALSSFIYYIIRMKGKGYELEDGTWLKRKEILPMIRPLTSMEDPPMSLLLSADPSDKMVQSYLDEGVCCVMEKYDQIIGVYILVPVEADTAEIANIAVVEKISGRAWGKLFCWMLFPGRRISRFRVFLLVQPMPVFISSLFTRRWDFILPRRISQFLC